MLLARLLLLEHFGELPGGLQQRQLALLPREIGIEKGHPFVVLIQAGVFDVAQIRAALVEFGLQQLQRFLGQLQVQASHFPGRVQFANVALLLQQVESDLLRACFPASSSEALNSLLASAISRPRLRRKYRNVQLIPTLPLFRSNFL